MRKVTRTFRIDPEYDEILEEEAEKQGLSVSALLSQLIQRYMLITRYNQEHCCVTMVNNTLLPLLESMEEKEIIEAAKKAATVVPEEKLLQRGKPLDRDTVLWFIKKVYGRYGHWFTYNHNTVKDEEVVHLSHQLGYKWSTYLKSYFTTMFDSMLDLKPKIENREHSATIYLPRRIPPKKQKW